MSSLPIAQWQLALDQMHAALTNAARTLQRAEERWERAVAPSAGDGALPPALDRLDIRLRDWDARLRAADELTDSVEKKLAERAGALERWRVLFAGWEEMLKQTAAANAPVTQRGEPERPGTTPAAREERGRPPGTREFAPN